MRISILWPAAVETAASMTTATLADRLAHTDANAFAGADAAAPPAMKLKFSVAANAQKYQRGAPLWHSWGTKPDTYVDVFKNYLSPEFPCCYFSTPSYLFSKPNSNFPNSHSLNFLKGRSFHILLEGASFLIPLFCQISAPLPRARRCNSFPKNVASVFSHSCCFYAKLRKEHCLDHTPISWSSFILVKRYCHFSLLLLVARLAAAFTASVAVVGAGVSSSRRLSLASFFEFVHSAAELACALLLQFRKRIPITPKKLQFPFVRSVTSLTYLLRDTFATIVFFSALSCFPQSDNNCFSSSPFLMHHSFSSYAFIFPATLLVPSLSPVASLKPDLSEKSLQPTGRPAVEGAAIGLLSSSASRITAQNITSVSQSFADRAYFAPPDRDAPDSARVAVEPVVLSEHSSDATAYQAARFDRTISAHTAADVAAAASNSPTAAPRRALEFGGDSATTSNAKYAAATNSNRSASTPILSRAEFHALFSDLPQQLSREPYKRAAAVYPAAASSPQTVPSVSSKDIVTASLLKPSTAAAEPPHSKAASQAAAAAEPPHSKAASQAAAAVEKSRLLSLPPPKAPSPAVRTWPLFSTHDSVTLVEFIQAKPVADIAAEDHKASTAASFSDSATPDDMIPSLTPETAAAAAEVSSTAVPKATGAEFAALDKDTTAGALPDALAAFVPKVKAASAGSAYAVPALLDATLPKPATAPASAALYNIAVSPTAAGAGYLAGGLSPIVEIASDLPKEASTADVATTGSTIAVADKGESATKATAVDSSGAAAAGTSALTRPAETEGYAAVFNQVTQDEASSVAARIAATVPKKNKGTTAADSVRRTIGDVKTPQGDAKVAVVVGTSDESEARAASAETEGDAGAVPNVHGATQPAPAQRDNLYGAAGTAAAEFGIECGIAERSFTTTEGNAEAAGFEKERAAGVAVGSPVVKDITSTPLASTAEVSVAAPTETKEAGAQTKASKEVSSFATESKEADNESLLATIGSAAAAAAPAEATIPLRAPLAPAAASVANSAVSKLSLPPTADWLCLVALDNEGCGPYFNERLNMTGAYCGVSACCSKSTKSCTQMSHRCTAQTQYIGKYSFGRCSPSFMCFACQPNSTCLVMNEQQPDQTVGGVYCDCRPPFFGKGKDCTLSICKDTNPCGEHGVCIPYPTPENVMFALGRIHNPKSTALEEAAGAAAADGVGALDARATENKRGVPDTQISRGSISSTTSNSRSNRLNKKSTIEISTQRSRSSGMLGGSSSKSATKENSTIISPYENRINSGTSLPQSSREGSSVPAYSCKCDPGYTLIEFTSGGTSISSCIDVCQANRCGAPAAVATCVGGNDAYQCTCNPGYHLETVWTAAGTKTAQKCVLFDACTVMPCGPEEAVKKCIPEGILYTCECNDGYVQRYTTNQPICIKEEDCLPSFCSETPPNVPEVPSISTAAPTSSSSSSTTTTTITTTKRESQSEEKTSEAGAGIIVAIVGGAIGSVLLLLAAFLWISKWFSGARRRVIKAAAGAPEDEDLPIKKKTIFDDDKEIDSEEVGPLQVQWEEGIDDAT